jgi:hypothetical protein
MARAYCEAQSMLEAAIRVMLKVPCVVNMPISH